MKRKETIMDEINEILRSLGRIEGVVDEFSKLNERVAKLEQWQNWLMGGWAFLAGALGYICLFLK